MRYVLAAALLLCGCFQDDGGHPPDGTETGGSATDETSSGVSDDTEDTGDSNDTGTGGSATDTSTPDDGTSSTSSAEACTVGSCPDGEFCVDGVCQEDPPPNMIVVPAGPFYRGCGEEDPDCDEDEFPADPDLFVSTFAIDRTAVTTADYAACVGAGGCTTAGTGAVLCNWGRAEHEDHPINCVTWFQAEAYCTWAGKRLLTQAEWEKAARGTDGRLYPWGDDDPSCDLAVIANGDGPGCGTGETWPVGSKPAGASPYGVFDAAGNTSAWMSDWYTEELEVDVDDPTGPASGDRKVVRGSTFKNDAPSTIIRISHRWEVDPDTNTDTRGIRCAAG